MLCFRQRLGRRMSSRYPRRRWIVSQQWWPRAAGASWGRGQWTGDGSSIGWGRDRSEALHYAVDTYRTLGREASVASAHVGRPEGLTYRPAGSVRGDSEEWPISPLPPRQWKYP